MSVALGVQLTELCGPGCLLCAGAGRAASPRSLAPDAFERVLLEARAVGIRRVVLSGGEPLIHEDLGAVLDLIETIDVEVELVSTGYRLEQREPALERLGPRLVRVTAEFLGGTASTHERTNGRPGSFQEARSALEVAAERKVPRRARLIPTAEALRELDGFKAAVARFSPEIVVDRSSTHLPRSAAELRSANGRCGDGEGEILAAVSASGRVYPCFASLGARALDEEAAPVLDVRLREALDAVSRASGRLCDGCRSGFARGVAALG
jgi:pyruvate-formate lyase-activating enzyme